ncbi:hypothetical protein [Hyphobacterium sp.]|uniref:hypothetical protein n=1 Tax=Hyphobacterium sp. TaxID=2004662 RepID=UPI003B51B191
MSGISPDSLPLDAGVAPYVEVLRAGGIDTIESCQGGVGHSAPEPFVRFNGDAFEGYRAFALAMQHGFPVAQLRRVYDVNDGQLDGPYWDMTFRGACSDRT